MKSLFKNRTAVALTSLLVSFWSSSANAADPLRLANKPLSTFSSSDALPNLLFVMDNSGSMNSDFTPDWVNGYSGYNLRSPLFNTQYYNPEVVYQPAVNYDGTSRGSQTNFTAVKNDSYDVQFTGTSNLVNGAFFYYQVAGEYCTDDRLIECIAATAPSNAYPVASPLRWCNTSAAATQTATPNNGSCRAVREGSFTNLRQPIATATITLGASINTIQTINGITLGAGGRQILAFAVSGVTTAETNRRALADSIVNQINACSNTMNGSCTIDSIRAQRTSANGVTPTVITVTSPYGSATGNLVITQTAAIATANATTSVVPGSMYRVDINQTPVGKTFPLPGSATKSADRTDCAGTVCTYTEEMTNYANWFTYYRTRMQGMKSSASLAFKNIKNNYRVGYFTINGNSVANSTYLPIAKFDTAAGQQKQKFYDNFLFKASPGGGTPLRQALANAGRLYAGKKPFGGTGDPIEYACQANYTLLTTDGYWNGSGGNDVNGSAIGNQDNGSTPLPQNEGNTAVGSLADIAYYYYTNDIRKSAGFNNCSGALGTNVCGEGANETLYEKQNMTTFTLGLGIDGTLVYTSDYKTQTSGDFAQLRSGALKWPVPEIIAGAGPEGPKHIDDLWHAAVNGNGTYFSAKDPKSLSRSLQKALSEIAATVGAGSGAAASTLQPVAGNNENLLPSYQTIKWTGNIEARKIDLITLETAKDAIWCAEDVITDTCETGGVIAADTNPNTGKYFCSYASSNTTACNDLGGTLSGSTCRVEVATSCTGKMRSLVDAYADTRKIKFNNGGSLSEFVYPNLPNSLKEYFQATYLSTHLNQWSDFSVDQKAAAVEENLVNYLRGQFGYEMRETNPTNFQVFRTRDATLGDITDSQPAFINKQVFAYKDAGYSAFRATRINRKPRLYVGANDGMLHVFDATQGGATNSGKEMYAFIPTPVIPKLWRLADRDYAINHSNYVNGDPVVGDVYDAGSGGWKTILVAGLGSGGRGYYALDITNEDSPVLLWEYTSANNPNLGYSMGKPVIVKRPNGTWTVLITSGYNNGSSDFDKTLNASSFINYGSTQANQEGKGPAGDGRGYLIALNPITGAVIQSFPTNSGSSSSPSGLAYVAAFVESPLLDNTAKFVYGGDLNGDLWRFDISTNGSPATKVTNFMGPDGVAQPIAVTPIINTINNRRFLMFGTGKYLEEADTNTANSKVQSLYGIIDDDASNLSNPRGSLVKQTIVDNGVTRSITTKNAVDYNVKLGWMIDLPLGERQNIDGLLINGALFAATVLPNPTSCSPGGVGYLNFFNYSTGLSLLPDNVVSDRLNAPIVGINLLLDKDGNAKIDVTTANNPDPVLPPKGRNAAPNTGNRPFILKKNANGTFGKRRVWRELIP